MESSEKIEEYKKITDQQQKLQFELIKEGVPVEVLNQIFSDACFRNMQILCK
ncbi:hypothetical protein [Methanococcus sp. CF]